MRSFPKKAFFFIYVAGVRLCTWFTAVGRESPATFIWKDSWFLFWHFFLWGCGRWVLAHFTTVEPLVHELSQEAIMHHRRFNELASRDARSRPIEQRIIKPTRYRLAPDTAKELCLFYGCVAAMAPWEYGLESRLRAKKRTRNVLLASFVTLVASAHFYSPGTVFLAWLVYLSFMATMISLSGWCASSSLCRMAREAERLCDAEKNTT